MTEENRDPTSRSSMTGMVVRRLAQGAAQLVYREIDINASPTPIPSGPTLAVSNHFGGLADGILLVDAAPQMPRIVARDVIFKVPVVGQLFAAAGGIPVHRRADGGPTSNDETFGSVYQALDAGHLVLIFPEGVTQDVPHMAPIKTGAARMALGARAQGTRGIHVLPMGLHYENKAGFRSRALVNVGTPIDLDAWYAAYRARVPEPEGPDAPRGADDHEAVHALTDTIEAAMHAVAPNYPDWSIVHDFEMAAEVALDDVSTTAAPLRYGPKALIASRLNRRPPQTREAILTEASRYRQDLIAAETEDAFVSRALGGTTRPSDGAWWRDLFVGLVLLPWAVAGAAINIIPLLLLWASRLIPSSPAVRATTTPALALLLFGGQWALLSWQTAEATGWQSGVLALIVIPLFSFASVIALEKAALLLRRWRARRHPAGTDLERLSARRRRVQELTWEAL